MTVLDRTLELPLTWDPRVSRGDVHDPDFGVVFREHRDEIFRLALLLCADRHAAEDATADAFARVFVVWKRGSVTNVRAYLRRAVVNRVRGGWSRRLLELRTPAVDRDALVVADAAKATADHDALLGALRRLPPRQRVAIVLRYFEDMTEAETASALGVSVGTVKAQVSRGLVRLRAMSELGGDVDDR